MLDKNGMGSKGGKTHNCMNVSEKGPISLDHSFFLSIDYITENAKGHQLFLTQTTLKIFIFMLIGYKPWDGGIEMK